MLGSSSIKLEVSRRVVGDAVEEAFHFFGWCSICHRSRASTSSLPPLSPAVPPADETRQFQSGWKGEKLFFPSQPIRTRSRVRVAKGRCYYLFEQKAIECVRLNLIRGRVPIANFYPDFAPKRVQKVAF